MSYTALVLFQKKNPPFLEDIASIIEQRFFQRHTSHTPFKSVIQERALEIWWEHWKMSIHVVDLPHVLLESQEIAHHFASNSSQAQFVTSCDARLEVVGEPDPGMVYFNTFLFVLEALSTLPNVAIFDTASETLFYEQ